MEDFTKLYNPAVLNKEYCCEIEMVYILFITLEGNDQLKSDYFLAVMGISLIIVEVCLEGQVNSQNHMLV